MRYVAVVVTLVVMAAGLAVAEHKPADLTELLRQEVQRRKALQAAEEAFRQDGNRSTLDRVMEAQKKERLALTGRKVTGTVRKVDETTATLEYREGEHRIEVAALSSYRLSDPVLFRLKAGQEVRVEGTVVDTIRWGRASIVLAGCLFGTGAERKAAGPGAIKDPEKARIVAHDLMRQVGGTLRTLHNRIVLEDLVRNCPNTPEAAEARRQLKRFEVADGDQAKGGKPAKEKALLIGGIILRVIAQDRDMKAVQRLGNQNLVVKLDQDHRDERDSWVGKPVVGRLIVTNVGGDVVRFGVTVGNATWSITAKAADRSDPMLLRLVTGNLVEVRGILKSYGYRELELTDCTFAAVKGK
jgi:hypothetical protein